MSQPVATYCYLGGYAAAEADCRQILRWTMDSFGSAQARNYVDSQSSALNAPSAGPAIIGVKERPGIGSHVWTLDVARNGRKGRAFLLFRIGSDVIDALRLLHDRMDLERHLPG